LRGLASYAKLNFMNPFIRYAGGHLDRAGLFRKDDDWISAQLSDPKTQIVPVWRSKNLIDELDSAPKARLMDRADANEVLAMASQTTLLGIQGDIAYFAADLSILDEDPAHKLFNQGIFTDLRHVGPLLGAKESSLLAHARGMLFWHQKHQHCGVCGALTKSHEGGHVRKCVSTECGAPTFPRTDPAVIMLITHQPASGPAQCLLGRQGVWSTGNYSTLAGFVEPGESLEEAVAREVHEEAGIHIKNVTYQASQPWPFPASIMLGFWGEATTTNIQVDENEIEDAQWFNAPDLRGFGEWGDEDAKFHLPRRDSISRYLIETWLTKIGV
jgi:NAD+ diphosphatase